MFPGDIVCWKRKFNFGDGDRDGDGDGNGNGIGEGRQLCRLAAPVCRFRQKTCLRGGEMGALRMCHCAYFSWNVLYKLSLYFCEYAPRMDSQGLFICSNFINLHDFFCKIFGDGQLVFPVCLWHDDTNERFF